MLRNIMFVCVGNICRSPMAEGLLKLCQPDLNVFSAGTGALIGEPADKFSIELMHEEKKIDLYSHRAQQINSTLVSSSDLILTMETKQNDFIHLKFPEARGKVFLLGKWIDNQQIPDPYKKDKKYFASTLELIETGLDAWKNKL